MANEIFDELSLFFSYYDFEGIEKILNLLGGECEFIMTHGIKDLGLQTR
jgi:hypothetical protein